MWSSFTDLLENKQCLKSDFKKGFLYTAHGSSRFVMTDSIMLKSNPLPQYTHGCHGTPSPPDRNLHSAKSGRLIIWGKSLIPYRRSDTQTDCFVITESVHSNEMICLMSEHLTLTTEAKKPPRWHYTTPPLPLPPFFLLCLPSLGARERDLRCTLRELAALQSPATATFPLIRANGDMSSYHGNWQASEMAPCAGCRRVCVRTGCRSIRVELCGLEINPSKRRDLPEKNVHSVKQAQ